LVRDCHNNNEAHTFGVRGVCSYTAVCLDGHEQWSDITCRVFTHSCAVPCCISHQMNGSSG
ncbi:hypothetical protein T4E_8888, partial [Trichinella pseudospiralis]